MVTTKTVNATKKAQVANTTTQKASIKASKANTAQQKALAQAKQNVLNKVQNGIGVTQHTNGNIIKGLQASPQIAKPTLKMCRYITLNKHSGVGNCVKRWHLYKNNQTLLCAKLTNGQTPNDLTFWATCKVNGTPYLTLTTPTQTQYNAIVNLWQNGKLTPANIQNVLKTVK